MIKCTPQQKVIGQFIKPDKDRFFLMKYGWLKKYATVNHRSLYGEKGFVLKNGTFERFEPIGITWNDSYCRRIKDAGPSGCFVERDLSVSADFDSQENNCTGTDSTNLLELIGLLQGEPLKMPTI